MNIIKFALFAGFCSLSLSVVATPDAKKCETNIECPDKCEPKQDCNIYRTYPNESWKAYKLCESYCDNLDCANSCPQNIQICQEKLLKFQALGLGDPVCVAPKRAYITNFEGNKVTVCAMTPTGDFVGCVDSGVGAEFVSPVDIILNKAGSTAYITNYNGNTVSQCAVNTSSCTNSGLFTGCEDSGVGAIFTNPFGIVLNKAENTAYVTNNLGPGSSSVFKCTLSNGAFTNCVPADVGGVINAGTPTDRSVGIVLNCAETLAYVANDTGGAVFKCEIDNSGLLVNCTSVGSGFSTPLGIVLNPAGTIAYITDHATNAVFKCSIDSTTGDLINCTDSGVGAVFVFPLGITLNKTGDKAYVANGNSDTISKCTIDINPIA